MDFESWQVDLKAAVIKHPSGFKIVFEGNPADPSNIAPSNFPAGLTAAEQARLMRCAMQALTKAARSAPRSSGSGMRSTGDKPAVAFKSKGSRPVLSLKR